MDCFVWFSKVLITSGSTLSMMLFLSFSTDAELVVCCTCVPEGAGGGVASEVEELEEERGEGEGEGGLFSSVCPSSSEEEADIFFLFFLLALALFLGSVVLAGCRGEFFCLGKVGLGLWVRRTRPGGRTLGEGVCLEGEEKWKRKGEKKKRNGSNGVIGQR